MLQSILSAVILYHIIKAIVRSAKRRNDKPKEELPRFIRKESINRGGDSPLEQVFQRIGASHPWAKPFIEAARTPLGLRNLILGAIFLLVGLLLTPIGFYFMIENMSGGFEDDTFLGSVIMGAIGLGTIWMGWTQFRDGLRLLRLKPNTMLVTGAGATPVIRAKPTAPADPDPDRGSPLFIALIGLFLMGGAAYLGFEAITSEKYENLVGVFIIGGIGLGTVWLILAKPPAKSTVIGGAAVKPQPTTKHQKKREDQFRQL